MVVWFPSNWCCIVSDKRYVVVMVSWWSRSWSRDRWHVLSSWSWSRSRDWRMCVAWWSRSRSRDWWHVLSWWSRDWTHVLWWWSRSRSWSRDLYTCVLSWWSRDWTHVLSWWSRSRDLYTCVCVMVMVAWLVHMCLRDGHGRVTDDMCCRDGRGHGRGHGRVTDDMCLRDGRVTGSHVFAWWSRSRDWTHVLWWWSRDWWPYIIKRRSSVHELFLNNYKWYKWCDDVLFWISLKWDVWRMKKG